MAAPSSSRILVLVEPPTAYLRCIGRAAVERARDFKQLVLQLDAQGIRRFCLDLTECKLMDSTFSGTLAALANDLGTPEGGPDSRFVLLNPNERVRDLLDNLGVLSLVTVLDSSAFPQPCPGAPSEELAAGPQDRAETTQCCLDAHQFLMKVDPRNVAKFQDLTRALAAEQAATAGQH
ncbi:MAG: STAS domain-containing protein [Verrucomicrobiae bacterium]|nr:STAS domain-containing protein [Verrucomicrobiae bacterium]